MQRGEADRHPAALSPGLGQALKGPVGGVLQDRFKLRFLLFCDGRLPARQRLGGQGCPLSVQACESLDAGEGDAKTGGDLGLGLPLVLQSMDNAFSQIHGIRAHEPETLQLQCQKERQYYP